MARKKKKVTISKSQTVALWTLVISEKSKFRRGASASPACGPVPVTMAPMTIARKARLICPIDRRAISGDIDYVLTNGVRRRECSEVAAAINRMDRRR